MATNETDARAVGKERRDTERHERVRRLLDEHDVDALVVRLPENVLLLAGFWPMIGLSHAVFSREGGAMCLIPECYEAEAEAELAGVTPYYFPHGRKDSPPAPDEIRRLLGALPGSDAWKRVAWEASAEATAPAWNAADAFFPSAPTARLLSDAFSRAHLEDGTSILAELKRTKTPLEIERMGRASEIANIGLAAFERAVEPGRSGVELAALVEHAVMAEGSGRHGTRRVRAFAQVAVGGAEGRIGFRPNEISTTRRLAEGEIALLELGVVVDGYWSDRTRPCVAGTPSTEQLEAFEVVRRAQEAAIAAVAPGVEAGAVDEAARGVIREAGMDSLFPHIVGHGVGFAYHEPSPIIRPGSTELLEAGMVHTVEPGVYDAALGGIRIEDDVVVTQGGAVVLGPFRKELSGRERSVGGGADSSGG
ncbi:MAG: M24 family metallopeptidase [Spirochaetaceae bacterium]